MEDHDSGTCYHKGTFCPALDGVDEDKGPTGERLESGVQGDAVVDLDARQAIKIDALAFESKQADRGYTVKASYLTEPKGDAFVEIFKDDTPLRAFQALFDGLELPVDYSTSRVRVPLSAGINSAAVLCALGEYHPEHLKPLELHLYYAHLKEHSPDSFSFVANLVRYARRKFPSVKVKITRASVNRYFIEQKMIPHPTVSPCSRELKIEPMQAYDVANGIDVVLIGYVRHEVKRHAKAVKRTKKDGRTKDCYPLLSWTDEDCFELVKEVIGWYPAIYDIKWTSEDLASGRLSQKRRFEVGRRVFTHNNCLPCKNMTSRQLQMVEQHFPSYVRIAQATANQIPGAYWGRDDVPDIFKCDACDRM